MPLSLTESIKVPKNVLIDFVIDNMMNVAEHVNIIKIEDRLVNGLPVTYLRVDATIWGIDINYMIYLHCGSGETIQVYSYSYGNFFKDLENFMNGLSKLK